MKKPLQLWFLFVLCLVMILPAMIWLTYKAVELDHRLLEDRRQTELARREAELQEKITSALYRMDWKLGPHIAREAARPWYLYESFYDLPPPASKRGNTDEQAVISMPSPRSASLPSPLLYQQSEFVQLHFQITPAGDFSSPQRPVGEAACRQALVCCGINDQAIQARETQLQQVRQFCSYDRLNDKIQSGLPFAEDQPPPATVETIAPQQTYAPQQIVNFVEKFGGQIEQNPVPGQGQTSEKLEPINKLQTMRAADRGGKEFLKRQQSYSVNTIQWADNNRALENTFPVVQPRRSQPLVEGVMRPIWVGDELVLVRRTLIEGQYVLQCCWLAWANIQEALREEVKDILPEVHFEPVLDEEELVPGRALVTLPAQLVVDVPQLLSMLSLTPDETTGPRVSGVQIALWLAWCGLALSAIAIGSLLYGVIRLSERRATFVSAVTHELRTPLTTFKMYSEMLADDMVPPQKRHQYASTLKSQADRLSHLVENVLQFARLERGTAEPRLQRMSVKELVERFQESLIERANQAGMSIRFSLDHDVSHSPVNVEPRTIEQILFNLVDNACKYARSSADAAIDIDVRKSDRWLQIVVRDFGPGVDLNCQKRLFQPFCKSDLEAANSAPGVGLGLALCRRMAQSLGGKLAFQSGEPGARFTLTVPVGL